ncbi:hypothetical protein PIB30_005669 [Stylosanthes scabra]|uniref:RNase H type-1 domain-containing protein n=1 Tax=Stylosanthes scabra TaxID=79078 RepID=A0ABU6U4W1_9FABA|nr:hypothetical protein [Stylosanthes scabra]
MMMILSVGRTQLIKEQRGEPGSLEESTLHAIRDCPEAALIWNKLVKPSMLTGGTRSFLNKTIPDRRITLIQNEVVEVSLEPVKESAELREVVDGLSTAWGLGIIRLMIQTDSREVVENILEEDSNGESHNALIRTITDYKL